MVRAVPYVGQANGSGARLIKRIPLRTPGTVTEYVPDGAAWCVVAGIGAGGTREATTNNFGAGGGGAFARAEFPVNPVDTIVTTVPNRTSVDNSAGADFVATWNGTEKVRAKGGLPGSGNTGGAGGPAGSCVGDIKRTGGSGGTGGGTLAQAHGSQGLKGPPASLAYTANNPTGGTPASDFGDDVAFGMGEEAATIQSPTEQSTGGRGCGGWGGASANWGKYGGAGEGVIEFWTSNPNP